MCVLHSKEYLSKDDDEGPLFFKRPTDCLAVTVISPIRKQKRRVPSLINTITLLIHPQLDFLKVRERESPSFLTPKYLSPNSFLRHTHTHTLKMALPAIHLLLPLQIPIRDSLRYNDPFPPSPSPLPYPRTLSSFLEEEKAGPAQITKVR